MNGGSILARRFLTVRTTSAVFILVILLLQAGYVQAQTTPVDACVADSLYLISPDTLYLELTVPDPGVYPPTERRGLTISWPNLDLNEATCFGVINTADLAFDVTVTGGFGDRVDRIFSFTSPDSGDIGAIQPKNIIVTWQNEGPSTYGNIGGKMNLANNGGIWRYENGGGWTQANGQLPMSWLQVNTVALAAGSGDFMLAGFSRGVTAESSPVGLFTFDGAVWTQIASETFNSEKLITDIAISPQDNNEFAVGTARNGLFITTDGGQTFTQWTLELDPDYPDMPTNFNASVVEWAKAPGNSTRIFTYVNNFGLFISPDNGLSFNKSAIEVLSNLDNAESDSVTPVINALSFHPTDLDRVAASLEFHGAFESMDGGATWQDLYGDLVVSDPEVAGKWSNTGLDLVYDDVSDQTMILGVKQKGLYRTTDGGATWVLVADSLQPTNRGRILELTMTRQTGSPGSIFVLEDGLSLLHSIDSGSTWEHFDPQPVITKGYFLLDDASGSGNLTMGSWGGGVYIAGTPIYLSDTYTTITSTELRSLDLGLVITFYEGLYRPSDSFGLTCQTFQGWAVWRGAGDNSEEMTLIGLYDRVNPEDCFEGYCGDVDIVIVPNCFVAKRAACFNLSNLNNPDIPDSLETIEFFDEEIYNGFTYNYSVTSFDYGNMALTTAENNTNEMFFSPRFAGDDGISIYPGLADQPENNYNQTEVTINFPIDEDDEEGRGEIYVFPNPLRMGAGLPGYEGDAVIFRNIPEGSKVLIFTTAGDRVIDLGHNADDLGNLHWNTRNSSGEPITSGVYIYKVEIPGRDDYWGRLVVIR